MPLQIHHSKSSQTISRGLRPCLEELLTCSGRGEAFLELSFVGRARMRSLNRAYLGHDRVTDVLSFPLDVQKPRRGAPWHLGEVVICTEVARGQAREAGRRVIAQILRLAIHGFVHLHGLDHEAGPQEAARFHRLEAKYLRHLHRKKFREVPSWDGSLQL